MSHRTTRRSSLFFAVALAVAAATAGCATAGGSPTSAWGAEWVGAPGTMRLDEVPFPAHLRDLLLTPYPTARRAELGEVLLPLDGATWVGESDEGFHDRLRGVGLEIGWRELPAEGFLLAASLESGRTVVLLGAKDAAGRVWADLAVEQLVHETADGRRFLRACRVLDAPVFPLRGSKRPEAWELRYRANFMWETRAGKEEDGRERVATFAPPAPFDATPEAADRVLEEWRAQQARGVRRFCLKFDDLELDFVLTPEAQRLHGGYPEALRAFLSRLRDGLRRGDPGATLYYLPPTYWWTDARLPEFGDSVRAAGGLDDDIGLVVTGPDVVSDRIDEIGLAAARLRFGLVRTPALVYDNLGREGDWGPLTGRDPRLRTQCDGVFGERGTPVHRLTRLDWLWNPHAYDAERSWRRAILELAGPAGYDALEAACVAYRRRVLREEAVPIVRRFADLAGPDVGVLPRRRVAALLRSDLGRLRPAAEASARSRP